MEVGRNVSEIVQNVTEAIGKQLQVELTPSLFRSANAIRTADKISDM
jgi:hypothetical protein